MKLLKIFGIVAGIHLFALVLIFANPGCSATSKNTRDADKVVDAGSTPVVSVPQLGPTPAPANDQASTQLNAFGEDNSTMSAPIAFNPDSSSGSADGRFRPTRPETTMATALKEEPVKDVVPVSTYTVVKGDSLWSIAKRNNLTVSELAASNNLTKSSMLKIGQKLIIPGKSTVATPSYGPAKPAKSEPVAPKPAAPKTELVTHVVESGQTLGGIARKYKVSVGTIATANNIADPAKIRPGQKLLIPGATKPAESKPVAPKVVERKPAPAASTPPASNQPPVIQTDDAPVLFTAPPQGQQLDEGFGSEDGDAPVIQIEEAN